MKPAKTVDDDREPLLYPVLAGQVAVAAEEARLHEQGSGAVVPERHWDGHLLCCWGSCNATGWLSFLFSYFCPSINFGLNAKRGFRASAWLHGLLFLVLFGLGWWAANSALAAAQHNWLATCNGPLPHPPHPHPPHPEDGPLHPPHHPPHHLVDIWGPEGVLGRFFPWLHPGPPHHPPHAFPHLEHEKEDDEEEVIVSWGTFENSNVKHQDNEGDDDDDDHHRHHHKHDDDQEGKHKDHKHKAEKKAKKAEKKAKKDKQADRKILPGATLDLDLVKAEAEPRQLQANVFTRPQPHDFSATPECRQAIGIYVGAWVLVIASFLVAVHYAARRRTMLRTKFGIAGSKMRDFCAWFWCPSCALCQETRTLWVNEVRDGVWNGPARVGYVAVPTLPPANNQAPPAQFMTTSV